MKLVLLNPDLLFLDIPLGVAYDYHRNGRFFFYTCSVDRKIRKYVSGTWK